MMKKIFECCVGGVLLPAVLTPSFADEYRRDPYILFNPRGYLLQEHLGNTRRPDLHDRLLECGPGR